MPGFPRLPVTHLVAGAACAAVAMAAAPSLSTAAAPSEFPTAASEVPLGPPVTDKVPNEIDPYGKVRPPAAIVTMRLPKGVTYDPFRVVHVGKPIRAEYYGSGWFQGHGWDARQEWGQTEPTAMITNGLGFGWARTEQQCDGATVDLVDGVRTCEAFYTIHFGVGGSGKHATGEYNVQVVRLWKHATDGGYLYLGLRFPAGAINDTVFNEALAIMGSAETLPHKGPLAWPIGPTHRPRKCFGVGQGGVPVPLPLSDCGPVAGPAGHG